MSLLSDASLVMIPSGYKDGTLYSAKPTNGDGDFTFSRGSNLAATRVNSDGLIEKGRENLLLQSNQFDTTWSLSNGTLTGGQTGYDGSSDAWQFDASGTAQVSQSVSTSGVQTYSVYAKAGTENGIFLRANGGSNPRCFFNLDSGTIGSEAGGLIDSNIEDIGNGWYRCSIVYSDTTNEARIYVANNSNGFPSSGNILIQSAQLEQSMVATDYIETGASTAQAGILEDMPRLDYSGGATCPSLLLEPQRTNVITQSEYFGAWSKSYTGTGSLPIITVNEAISPEGLQNASKIVLDKGSGQTSGDYAFIQLGTTMTGDATYSIYLKSATSSSYEVALRIVNTITTVTVNSEWQRFDVSATSTTNPTAGIWLRGGYSSSDYAEFYAYGAQVEAGSYPTSYIPTYGASVTRGSDYPLLSSASSIIGQTEGTAFVEFKIDRTISGTTRVITISDGGANERIGISLSTSVIYAFIVDGGVTQAEMIKSTSPSGRYKAAIAYKSNDVVFYLNGEQVGTDTSATMPTTNEIELGNQFGAAELGGGIKQALLFKTRLTNDELASLTTI